MRVQSPAQVGAGAAVGSERATPLPGKFTRSGPAEQTVPLGACLISRKPSAHSLIQIRDGLIYFTRRFMMNSN